MTEIDAAQLPALCDSAIRDLAEVKTIGECLEIRNVMEAARVYAAKHKMAQEAQNACVKIVVLAERRIGLELAEARKRGELARQGQHDNPEVVTLEELNISDVDRKKFSDAASLEAAEIEAVADEAVADGKVVKKSAFKEAARKKRQRREPPPVILPKPPHLTQFSLWLRTGSQLLPQFADHRELMSLAGRHGVTIDPEQVTEIMEFLAALSAGLNADRAA